MAQTGGEKDYRDTNYIFLTFVTRYLPAGLVGLVIAVIFAAAMSASSGEINSLATVTMIDIYKRHIRTRAQRPSLSERVARGHGILGGVRGGAGRFRQESGIADRSGERVGLACSTARCWECSCWRSSSAGCMARARSGACWPAKSAIFACFFFTGISFLWYNVIGCVVVIATAVVVTVVWRGPVPASGV